MAGPQAHLQREGQASVLHAGRGVHLAGRHAVPRGKRGRGPVHGHEPGGQRAHRHGLRHLPATRELRHPGVRVLSGQAPHRPGHHHQHGGRGLSDTVLHLGARPSAAPARPGVRRRHAGGGDAAVHVGRVAVPEDAHGRGTHRCRGAHRVPAPAVLVHRLPHDAGHRGHGHRDFGRRAYRRVHRHRGVLHRSVHHDVEPTSSRCRCTGASTSWTSRNGKRRRHAERGAGRTWGPARERGADAANERARGPARERGADAAGGRARGCGAAVRRHVHGGNGEARASTRSPAMRRRGGLRSIA